jgi:hypothetical protein
LAVSCASVEHREYYGLEGWLLSQTAHLCKIGKPASLGSLAGKCQAAKTWFCSGRTKRKREGFPTPLLSQYMSGLPCELKKLSFAWF